ncbi:ABC transporter ATP-binding protein [Syntrophus aciditrophicus]|uniref:Lipoprotein-releasing system ATP-binding protein LolD n=1 Tax=Syntrophus aciditrophicus (strain SB) TaxID=56780 RepID=LOLD_SYNAS|nr:ABC transporter ATP-binding protein [Syntrophus aciditrophicus]Q2LVM2.1 RecName: Full=Lipoprotein-releasing system ATP-binding protein LolD [Syntrophus aciditrophicus SB]ABC78130.1 lipoprotein releasing system ATP-binding protein [Syntrophus aciditrophicus SB]OPY18882.1 MAG: Lipoprotein-releasing system ATP-binding protein LolD [Syntrophus sp. PtaB.Bin075]
MIQVRNLKKTFIKDGNRIEVLRGLDLKIEDGTSLAILGVSGAGKTTFVHILGTLDHPTSGEVLFNGLDVFNWPEKKLASFRNRTIGFVFQFHNLLPEFSSLENTMMPALISGMPRRNALERAETLLHDVGLGDRMTHKPSELSGGEQQRVAVARALVMEPEILLADEPTGNLDTETGRKIEDILLELNRQKGITLIVVTHNQSLAGRMSRSIGLRDGEIVTCA